MLEQCKLKSEDFDKFKRDQIDAEVLEKKKAISRKTIRSKAAQTIEKISGNLSHFHQFTLEKFQKDVFITLRGHLERYLNSKLSWEEK